MSSCPHLDVAYRLARWLMRNEHDAEDVVQEASLRAFRYFRTFTGGDGRAWFLRIVRNICSVIARPPNQRTHRPIRRRATRTAALTPDPETLLLQTDDAALVTGPCATCLIVFISCSCSASWRSCPTESWLTSSGSRSEPSCRDCRAPVRRCAARSTPS